MLSAHELNSFGSTIPANKIILSISHNSTEFSTRHLKLFLNDTFKLTKKKCSFLSKVFLIHKILIKAVKLQLSQTEKVNRRES